jgi:hypothetical protein
MLNLRQAGSGRQDQQNYQKGLEERSKNRYELFLFCACGPSIDRAFIAQTLFGRVWRFLDADKETKRFAPFYS